MTDLHSAISSWGFKKAKTPDFGDATYRHPSGHTLHMVNGAIHHNSPQGYVVNSGDSGLGTPKTGDEFNRYMGNVSKRPQGRGLFKSGQDTCILGTTGGRTGGHAGHGRY
jgi:hypothetical protein